MLTGTAAVDDLAARAGTVGSFASEPVHLADVELLQATFELPYTCREPLLPSGLHPTTPPLLVLQAWRVIDDDWGSFQLVQARVSCRSGIRPRGFIVGALFDGDGKLADALARGWGLTARRGTIAFERGFDRVHLGAAIDGTVVLDLECKDPDPLSVLDVQYVTGLTLAVTPLGVRLVQVDTTAQSTRVERLRPALRTFDGSSWGSVMLQPQQPLAATIAVGPLTLEPVRYVCRPDVNAFEGTEAVQ